MKIPEKSSLPADMINLRKTYHDLFAPSPDSVFFLDSGGIIFDVNQSSVDLLKYSRDELCGLKITDLLTNVDLTDDPLHLSSLQIDHVIVEEEKLRRKDGKVIQVEIHNQKLHEEIVLIIVRDMTSQKEEQVIFHQMEDRYRLIVETATEGICTMDESNLITYVNSRLADMVGYSEKEMVGKTMEPFLYEEDIPHHRELMTLRLKGNAEPLERRLKRKDGAPIWVNVSPKPVLDDKGIYRGQFAIFTDITKEKRSDDIQKARLRILQFVDDHSLDELLRETLDCLGELTGSPIGFFHFLSPDQVSFTRRAWSSQAIRDLENYKGDSRHQPFDQVGIWKDCIRDRKVVIVNGPDSLGDMSNMPKGHPEISRLMALPIIRGDKVVALLGIGAKSEPYNEGDVTLVTSFADLVWDIAERKIAEEELKQNALQYQAIISTSLDGFSMCSSTGKIMEANDAYCRMLGYTRDELLKLSIPDIEAQEMPEETATHIRAMTDNGSERFETQHKRKDGTIIDVEVNTTYMPDAGIFTTFTRDITERKRAEEALRENRELLTLFISHSPIYSFIKDVTSSESRVIQVSDNYIQMVGISSQDMAGKTMQELFPPEFAAKITADDWAVVTSDKVLELYEELNDRSYITFKYPIHQRGKTLLAGYTIDITDTKQSAIRQKEAFEALQVSEENLKEAQKIANLGRWELNLKPRQLIWSDMIFEIFEIDPFKFGATYEAFLEAIHPDDRDEVNHVFNESLINHSPYEITHRLLMKDGRIKWVNEICRTEYDDHGEPVRSIGIVQDITNLKLAEEELIKREHLLQEFSGNGSCWKLHH